MESASRHSIFVMFGMIKTMAMAFALLTFLLCLLPSCESSTLNAQQRGHDDGKREAATLQEPMSEQQRGLRGLGSLATNHNEPHRGTLEEQQEGHRLLSPSFAIEAEEEQQQQEQPVYSHEMKLPMFVTAPNRRNYDYTVGLCAMVKDDGVYLEEWLDYQLGVLEFDGIIVFDNSHDFVWKHWYENTRQHPYYKKVEIIHLPNKSNVQRIAYTICATEFGYATNVQWKPDASDRNVDYASWGSNLVSHLPNRRRYDYMAYFDVDEFLVLKQHVALRRMRPPYHLGPVQPTNQIVDRIHDLIEDVWRQPLGGRGNLSINWILVGYSQKTLYSPLPVLKRFQYRSDLPDSTTKSILYTRDLDEILNAHGVRVKEQPAEQQIQNWAMDMVHTGQPAVFSNIESKASISDTFENELMEKFGDVALLYHVRYTSLEEYRQKRCVRLAPGGRVKGCDVTTDPSHPTLYMKKEDDTNASYPDHMYPHTGDVLDDAPWRLLKWKVPKYNMFDTVYTIPGNADEQETYSIPVWNDYHYMTGKEQ